MRTRTRNSVTLASIAEEVGVSIATVSYVLNNKCHNGRVSKPTIERVRRALKESGYIRNELAWNLRRQRTDSVALMVAELERRWAQRATIGLMQSLDPHGLTISLHLHFWSPEREARTIDQLLRRRIAGLITVPMRENAELYQQVRRMGIPVVFIQDALDAGDRISSCLWGGAAAARASVLELARRGRKRIVFYGIDGGTQLPRMRLEGYKQGLAEAGIRFRPGLVCFEPRHALPMQPGEEPDFGQALEGLFSSDSRRPDAILAMNDACAATALHRVRDVLGWRVPEDVALMGMGDTGESALVGLSSSSEPVEEVGRMAGERIVRLLRDPDHPAEVWTSDLVQLQLRSSTRPPRGL